jgi:two-component system NtrC family response regulator
MQVKMLRFLQEGTFVPVGGRTAKKADVRVVAATHRDLEAMVREGTFREDLYYRLKGVVLRTPSLSERAGDVPLLAARFLHRVARTAKLGTDGIAWVCARDWQGNVRELRAVVESAAALLPPGDEIIGADLLRLSAGEAPNDPAATSLVDAPELGLLDAAVLELETRLIKEAMAATGGNQSEAARRLGISRPGLIKKLARLGLR